MSTNVHPHTPGGRGITAADGTATTAARHLDDARALRGLGLCLDHRPETEEPTCVIPNCANAVDEDGQPCSDCLREFGTHLRICDTPPLTRAEIIDRDSYVHRAYQLQHQLRTASDAAIAPSPRRRGHRR